MTQLKMARNNEITKEMKMLQKKKTLMLKF